MRIGLINVDGKGFPNLPLMKLSAYHRRQGDTVEWYMPTDGWYDIVYVSKVFTFTPDYEQIIYADEVIYGGTGYDLHNKLPDEVEHICPDYSLYPQYDEAYGFLTRGCPRNCDFCIVSEKEGRCSRQVADLDEFWRGQSTIKLLDPNLLACNDRERLLQQLIDSGAYIDFTQGLDIRFTDDIVTNMISKMKIRMLHFAWDNANEDLTGKFAKFKQKTGLNERKLSCYVLTNFTSTHEQDLYRVYRLREIGIDPYVMIYDKQNAPRETRLLQRWVNNKRIWRKCERFEDYDPKIG